MMKNILELKKIYKYFPLKDSSLLQAGYDIDLDIKEGSLTAVIGESGCGKSTLGKICLGQLPPSQGEVLFDGIDIYSSKFKWTKKLRSWIQVVHQDSYSSLNPVRSIYQILSAPLLSNKIVKTKIQAIKKVKELLSSVELDTSDAFIYKYPFQLSGGQRQRVSIARSLILNPRLIIADEPVSAVDASSKLSILSLMQKLNKDSNIAFLYITHDLATARFFAPKGQLVVMYLGRIVEKGIIEECIESPKHPYLQALLKAIPSSDFKKAKEKIDLPLTSFDMPKANHPPTGCVFHPRCPYVEDECKSVVPMLDLIEGSSRQVACHKFTE